MLIVEDINVRAYCFVFLFDIVKNFCSYIIYWYFPCFICLGLGKIDEAVLYLSPFKVNDLLPSHSRVDGHLDNIP